MRPQVFIKDLIIYGVQFKYKNYYIIKLPLTLVGNFSCDREHLLKVKVMKVKHFLGEELYDTGGFRDINRF